MSCFPRYQVAGTPEECSSELTRLAHAHQLDAVWTDVLSSDLDENLQLIADTYPIITGRLGSPMADPDRTGTELSTTRRLNRIFRPDGRALIVALDHGLIDGPCPGFETPDATINAVVAGGPDAILTSYGIARRFDEELSGVGLILRSDGSATNLGTPSDGSSTIFFDAEDALRAGADAMVVTALPGSTKEDATLHNLATTIATAHSWGMPVLAEMVPGGFNSPPEMRSPDSIALATRLGAELGADFIKAPYCEGYGEVCASTFVPIVILGGAKGSEVDMLANIRDAIDAGAAGVAIGRNVFQCEDPTAMTRRHRCHRPRRGPRSTRPPRCFPAAGEPPISRRSAGTMSREAVLGLDAGTSSAKAVVVASDGEVLATGNSGSIPTVSPEPGAAEQDAEQVAAAVDEAATAAVGAGPPDLSIVAVAMAAQSGSVVPIDDNDRPMAKLVTWLDSRSGPIVESWDDATRGLIRSVSGWSPSTGTGLASVCWMQSRYHRPGRRSRALGLRRRSSRPPDDRTLADESVQCSRHAAHGRVAPGLGRTALPNRRRRRRSTGTDPPNRRRARWPSDRDPQAPSDRRSEPR